MPVLMLPSALRLLPMQLFLLLQLLMRRLKLPVQRQTRTKRRSGSITKRTIVITLN